MVLQKKITITKNLSYLVQTEINRIYQRIIEIGKYLSMYNNNVKK